MATQSLSLSQSQRMQMVMAPQLRQSLEMLQVPILELRAMIQKELEMNPTIEELAPEGPQLEVETSPGEPDDNSEMRFDEEFEVLAKLDDEWRDYFFQDIDNRPGTPEDDERHQFLMDSLPQTESLQEHLTQQLQLSDLSEVDRKIAELLIGSIDDDGYLSTPLEELANTSPYEMDHLLHVLMTIQDFHPVGVGAADLRDCLLLQLERMGKADTLAGDIVRNHIDALALHKFDRIARDCKTTTEKVREAAAFIATLDPAPGRAFSATMATYIFPEVVIRKSEDGFSVILNDDRLPHLRISKEYRDLMENPDTPKEVKLYIRDKLRASAFLLRSIDQRQRTIHRIASSIVNHQAGFLEHGVAQLRPMTMAEVAEEVGVHETTVSRAVNQKYMRTPQGTFEMKYFFTTGLKTEDGSDISTQSVKRLMQEMVEAENPHKPLSDLALMQQLHQQGIKVARRTIAKYRDMLHIAPSHLRKRG
ncbi:MAG: RNA polymerase factor sigma-54 [Kiritimatiellia bacterium]